MPNTWLDNLVKDKEFKENFDLKLHPDNLIIANDSLVNRGASKVQRAAVLSNIISESGGDTKAHGNGAFGLVGWRGTRAVGLPKNLPGQLHKLMVETFERPKDWHHGGPGMNINSSKEMYEFWKSGAGNSVRKATNAMTRGYVRPPKEQYEKRIDLANILFRYLK